MKGSGSFFLVCWSAGSSESDFSLAVLSCDLGSSEDDDSPLALILEQVLPEVTVSFASANNSVIRVLSAFGP